jgi:Zn-dependent protease
MEKGLLVGRVWGIPIRLHLSWIVIFVLVSWSMATGFYPQSLPYLSPVDYWVLGVLTSLLFAASVLGHELGHAYLALRNKIPVKGVTLFVFGGMALIAQEPPTAGVEFRIAIAGPLASLALGLIFAVMGVLFRDVPFLADPSQWLGRINLSLAAFNMIPGFPLDGGRVLRAAVWRFSGDQNRATKAASITGQVIAFGFIAWGLVAMLTGGFFSGIWIVFIGWFLQNAASAAQQSVRPGKLGKLRGVIVAEVMSRNVSTIPAQMDLERLVRERVANSGQGVFLVTNGDSLPYNSMFFDESAYTLRDRAQRLLSDNTNGYMCGMLTMREVMAVPRQSWSRVTARDVMVPQAAMDSVSPGTELLTALQKMEEAHTSQIPVVENNTIQGILSREQIFHYIRMKELSDSD